MNSIHRAAVAILTAMSLASFSFNGFAQDDEELLDEDTSASTTTESTELPAAGIWAGLALLGVVAIIAGSDSDDSDGPTATVPP